MCSQLCQYLLSKHLTKTLLQTITDSIRNKKIAEFLTKKTFEICVFVFFISTKKLMYLSKELITVVVLAKFR